MSFGYNNSNNRGGFQSSGGGFGSGNNGGMNNNPNNNGNYNGGGNQGGYNSRGGGGNRGQNRGRGSRGRGRGGGGRGGGIKFANNICRFDRAVDAHCTQGRQGALCAAVWVDGNMVFSGGSDGVVKMFDITNGSSKEQTEGASVTSLCSFGSWLFCGYVNQPSPGVDVGFVKGYNFGTGAAPSQFNFEMSKDYPAAHATRVNSICVGGTMVFTGGADGIVRAWTLNEPQGWNLVGSLGDNGSDPVTKVAVFNNVLFTGSINGEIKAWSMQGQLHLAFPAHRGEITDMLGWTSPAGSVLITCSRDTTISVWNLSPAGIPSDPQPVFTYPPDNAGKRKAITSMTTYVLRNQSTILVVGFLDGSIQAFTLPDFTDLGFLSGHNRGQAITALVTVPTSELLFATSMDGKLNCFTFVS